MSTLIYWKRVTTCTTQNFPTKSVDAKQNELAKILFKTNEMKRKKIGWSNPNDIQLNTKKIRNK